MKRIKTQRERKQKCSAGINGFIPHWNELTLWVLEGSIQ